MTRLPPGASPKLPHTSEFRCTCGATFTTITACDRHRHDDGSATRIGCVLDRSDPDGDPGTCQGCGALILTGQPTVTIRGKASCAGCTIAEARLYADRCWPVPSSWVRLLLALLPAEVAT